MLSTNFIITKFPQAIRASGSCLSTCPTGNLHAIGIRPVLISQTVPMANELNKYFEPSAVFPPLGPSFPQSIGSSLIRIMTGYRPSNPLSKPTLLYNWWSHTVNTHFKTFRHFHFRNGSFSVILLTCGCTVKRIKTMSCVMPWMKYPYQSLLKLITLMLKSLQRTLLILTTLK